MAHEQAKLALPVGESDYILGSPEAAITLVEYGDYECVHCRAVHPILRELQERLGDRLRYVFRHFPISSMHPKAQLAAEAAEAAGAQGKFWEMHNLLFEHPGGLSEAQVERFAEQLGLDLERFRRDLAEHRHADRTKRDFLSGVRGGVNGTPTFFINGLRYDGAWDLESLLAEMEKPLGVQIRLLFQEFTRLQASGGIALVLFALLALIWANTPWANVYFHFWETELAIRLGQLTLSEHLLEWVNDGLMAIFFFVVGLEIKREITVGELNSVRKATLPIAGALGGIIVPAAIYLLFNAGGPGARGWGIPMATDIAFTLGVLLLLGNRVPLSLKVFFTALAIADDIGAVLVIALFYTAEIAGLALLAAAVLFVLLLGFNRARIYHPLPYALVGILLWLAFLESGVHPTIAGVLLALTIPARSPADAPVLLAQCVTLLEDYDKALPGAEFNPAGQLQAATQTLEAITERMQSPSQRLERNLHPWTTYMILPLFALSNAGVELREGVGAYLNSPVALGVIFGLVVGKPLGITLLSWLAVRLGLAELPAGVTWRQLISASFLAGIGFTIALFIAPRAFSDPALITAAKVGILIASLIAGSIGAVLMLVYSPHYDRATRVDVPLAPTMLSD